ncbi:MAG TPA: rubredoxin [Trichocoleus sp.]
MSAESETPVPASAEAPETEAAPEASLPEGSSPETLSPEPEPVELTPQEMDCYECRACGYTYEPVKGDNRGKIAAGVPFEEVPGNWKCPVCAAPKSQFSNIGPVGSPSGFKENLNYGLGVNRMTPGQKNLLIFGSLALAVLFFLSLYGLR